MQRKLNDPTIGIFLEETLKGYKIPGSHTKSYILTLDITESNFSLQFTHPKDGAVAAC